MTIADCQQKLTKMLEGRDVALDFIKLYVSYANLVDDIVDEKDFQNAGRLLEHANTAETLHSHPYWIANINWLRPVVLVVHNEFADSVELENDTIREGAAQLADTLRIAAFNVVALVVYNELGYNAMREISADFRYALWRRHKNENH